MQELSRVLKILLLPFSAVYYLIILLRNKFYDWGIFKSSDVGVKVISVGNISYGGTGKTPTVIYLTQLLKRLGKKPGILSRGYGRSTKGYKLVSNGETLFCNTAECGDEIIMEAVSCNVPAAVSEDRVAGATNFIDDAKIDTIVLDDAFQHRKIKRDIDLVLLDLNFFANAKFPDCFLLPSGVFREPFSSLNRADVILLNRKFNQTLELNDKLKKVLNGKTYFSVRYDIDEIYDVKTRKRYEVSEFEGQHSLAVSGIAQPGSFFTSLDKIGIKITEKLIFRDHKKYSLDDIQIIRKKFYDTNAYSIITTEKDAVKLIDYSTELDDVDIYFLKIKLVIDEEEKFISLIKNLFLSFE